MASGRLPPVAAAAPVSAPVPSAAPPPVNAAAVSLPKVVDSKESKEFKSQAQADTKHSNKSPEDFFAKFRIDRETAITCPIQYEPMNGKNAAGEPDADLDPVVTSCGHAFSKKGLRDHYKNSHECPLCRQLDPHKKIISVPLMKDLIHQQAQLEAYIPKQLETTLAALHKNFQTDEQKAPKQAAKVSSNESKREDFILGKLMTSNSLLGIIQKTQATLFIQKNFLFKRESRRGERAHNDYKKFKAEHKVMFDEIDTIHARFQKQMFSAVNSLQKMGQTGNELVVTPKINDLEKQYRSEIKNIEPKINQVMPPFQKFLNQTVYERLRFLSRQKHINQKLYEGSQALSSLQNSNKAWIAELAQLAVSKSARTPALFGGALTRMLEINKKLLEGCRKKDAREISLCIEKGAQIESEFFPISFVILNLENEQLINFLSKCKHPINGDIATQQDYFFDNATKEFHVRRTATSILVPSGTTPLIFAALVYKTAKAGSVKELLKRHMRYLAEHCGANIHARNSQGQTAYGIASSMLVDYTLQDFLAAHCQSRVAKPSHP